MNDTYFLFFEVIRILLNFWTDELNDQYGVWERWLSAEPHGVG